MDNYKSSYADEDITAVFENELMILFLEANKIGTYYGNRGSFLRIDSYQTMYLRFKSDSGVTANGFKATLVKDSGITS